jgi:MFS family permease
LHFYSELATKPVRIKRSNDKNELSVPEVAEISAGTNAAANRRFSTFPALQNRRYRLFFFGQFVSVIGTWMQIVAQGWLVLQFTTSPATLGFVAAMATVPSLLFSLFGGLAVDRLNNKKLLYITQGSNFVLSLSLGILTLLDLVTLPVLAGLAFCMGTVNAVDAPARQAFVSQIVTRDQLASAIALNSAVFNAARAIGPAISGLIIAYIGTGVAFIFNAFSYSILFLALNFIPFTQTKVKVKANVFHAIGDGIRYTFTHPLIRVLIIFTGVLSVFGWSYSTLMPLIAKTRYGLDAQGLGYFYTATGLGSLLATYLVGAHSKKISPLAFIAFGNAVFACGLTGFALTTDWYLAMPFLFLIGLGLLCQAATMNTLIQSVVRNEFRGRVMSLYVLMFLGFAPFGNFEIGFLSENLSIPHALVINAVVVLLFGLIVFQFRKRIRDAYRAYNQSNQ